MTRATDPESRLAELGIELPPPSTPAFSYVPTQRVGDMFRSMRKWTWPRWLGWRSARRRSSFRHGEQTQR
jgi:hypothetical protein